MAMKPPNDLHEEAYDIIGRPEHLARQQQAQREMEEKLLNKPFTFKPQERVRITPLECDGRVDRCILDGGPQPLYQVQYITNGEPKTHEFYEDELEELNK